MLMRNRILMRSGQDGTFWGVGIRVGQTMAGRQTKWRLAAGEDLDLEGDDRAVVREAGAGIKNEGKKRRRGLRAWLEYRRGEEDHAPGRRTVGGLRIVGFALALVAFVVAAGLARGLMQEFEGGRRMFNIWLFLGVTVGLPWVVLIGGAAIGGDVGATGRMRCCIRCG